MLLYHASPKTAPFLFFCNNFIKPKSFFDNFWQAYTSVNFHHKHISYPS